MNIFRRFFGHLFTITKHRHLVIKHCKKAGILWQGLRHDLSKYSPTEFWAGVKYYAGNHSPNEEERRERGYSLAWMHHKGRNKHHYEYWVDYNLETKRNEPVVMPYKYVAEMFCDRVAASKVYNGDKYTEASPLEYFEYRKPHRSINLKTRDEIEELLIMLKEKGEEETFQYIRKRLQRERSAMNRRDIPIVTAILIAINVIVFLAMEIIGDTENALFLYEHGAMYWPDVFEGGQWYRLVTHMFVHAGGEHLLNNMFMLGILGYQIEKEYGPIKYLLTYFISGIGGSLISALVAMNMGDALVSIGASGAVFGIFGVMLTMIFKNRRQMGEISAPRLLILFALMVFGNMEEGVDWMAHFGGALSGVVIGLLFYRPKHNARFNL